MINLFLFLFLLDLARDIALNDLLTSVRKSLLTLSFLAGCASNKGSTQTGTVHNPLSSLSSWCQSWYPLCSFSQHGVSHFHGKASFSCSAGLLDFLSSTCSSQRLRFCCANYSDHLAVAMSLQAKRIALDPSFCLRATRISLFSLATFLLRSTHFWESRLRAVSFRRFSTCLSDMYGCCGCGCMLCTFVYSSPVRSTFPGVRHRKACNCFSHGELVFRVSSAGPSHAFDRFSLHSTKTLLTSLSKLYQKVPSELRLETFDIALLTSTYDPPFY